jgi:hypothetical protein
MVALINGRCNMKIYISGIVDNKDYSKIEEWLKNKGYTPINPLRLKCIFDDLSCQDYTKLCYFFIDLCDSIFMVKGWQDSKTALYEMSYAKSLDKDIVYQGYYNREKKN